MIDAGQLIVFTGLFTAFFVNSFLIYLTLFYITCIRGIYKYMIVWFAFGCIIFDLTEFISRPHIHNFNGSLTYFSHTILSEDFLYFWTIFIDIYGGMYCSLITIIAVQFIFRYATLLNDTRILQTFKGKILWLWVLLVIGVGALFCVTPLIMLQPDDYADEYVKDEFHRVYSRNITEIARLILVAYVSSSLVKNSGSLISSPAYNKLFLG